MAILSDSEAIDPALMEQALKALPALRRWLVRSAPVRYRHREHGHRGHRYGNFRWLPVSHTRVLGHLYQHGPMTMGQLADGLGISYSTATECVAGLEAQGNVIRDRSEIDRRQVMVSLTPEAETIASLVYSQRKTVVEEVLRQLSRSQARGFVEGLLLLAKAVESQAPTQEVELPADEEKARG